MKCPACPTNELLMTVREGIEIDYCPQCRGVWLDRGELDQIIQRTEQMPGSENRERHVRPRHDEHRYDELRYGDGRGRYGHPRKKKSFLGELFDFD